MQNKKPDTEISGFIQCGQRDSNPHGIHHMLLRHTRLPIPPCPQDRYYYNMKITKNQFYLVGSSKVLYKYIF